MSSRNKLFAIVVSLGLAACGRSAGPLPGDSVSADGAVTLSPPRFSTAPGSGHDTHDALDPIASRLFPPELVMEHQGEIELAIGQRDAIAKEVERAQTELVRLQWDMQGEKEKLVRALDAERIDEAGANAAAARVMDLETKIKSTHLGMLVHVKNTLTPEQQRKLRASREEARCAQAGRAAPMAGSPSASPSTPRLVAPRALSTPSAPTAPKPARQAPAPSSQLDFR